MLMEFYDVSASAFLNQDGVDEAALADYFRTVLALDEREALHAESNDAALTMVASVSSNGGGYEIVDMGAYDLQAGFAGSTAPPCPASTVWRISVPICPRRAMGWTASLAGDSTPPWALWVSCPPAANRSWPPASWR